MNTLIVYFDEATDDDLARAAEAGLFERRRSKPIPILYEAKGPKRPQGRRKRAYINAKHRRDQR